MLLNQLLLWGIGTFRIFFFLVLKSVSHFSFFLDREIEEEVDREVMNDPIMDITVMIDTIVLIPIMAEDHQLFIHNHHHHLEVVNVILHPVYHS